MSNRNSLYGKNDPQVFEALAERAFVNLGIDNEPKVSVYLDVLALVFCLRAHYDTDPVCANSMSLGRKMALPSRNRTWSSLTRLSSLKSFSKCSRSVGSWVRLYLVQVANPANTDAQATDLVIQLFITDINYHYYIIYPPSFLQDYHIWWDRRNHNKTISLQYTCLLAMLCSGTIQHVSGDLQKAVEAELSDTSDNISDKLHSATRELTSVIPIGHYHMMNVQRLLHSAYWYKAEARFVEAWHVLNQAILEGKELGMLILLNPAFLDCVSLTSP